jgi:hypothetical protein
MEQQNVGTHPDEPGRIEASAAAGALSEEMLECFENNRDLMERETLVRETISTLIGAYFAVSES